MPWHTGGCQNLHGHSYEMWVQLTGPADGRGMVIDFKDIKKVVKPLVEAFDHAVLVDENDKELMQAIELLGSKHYVLPYDTTSENICLYVTAYIGREALGLFTELGLTSLRVMVKETETCFAELETPVASLAKNGATVTETSLA